MSKLDKNVINNIRLSSINMINSIGKGDARICLNTAPIFYLLYLNHLNFNQKDPNWINRDRLIVSNKLLPVLYATMYSFGFDISNEDLKEYNRFNAKLTGYNNPANKLTEIGSLTNFDVISSSVGINLGIRYLSALIKKEIPNSNLLNSYTYCICNIEDLMTGLAYESLSFAANQGLNKLIILCNHNNLLFDSTFSDIDIENLQDRFAALNINIINIKKGDNIMNIDDAIDEAKANKKKINIVIFNTNYGKDLDEDINRLDNKPLSNEDIAKLKKKYKITDLNKDDLKELNSIVNKRMNKYLNKWNSLYESAILNKKVFEIIDLMKNKNVKINFDSNNYQINDEYNEELINGNSKIFNLFATKSPFILSLCNDNYLNTLTKINKSENMNKDNVLGRNILFGNRTLAMGGVAVSLASLGFKVFISTPLVNSISLLPFINLSSFFNYPVYYIFTQNSFLNANDYNNISPYNEINTLRIIPNLITIRPADINEIIGSYELFSNYNQSCALIIGSQKIPKLKQSNPKYLKAGAYPVKKEINDANGIIIATGEEVTLALSVSKELLSYGIDLRVISMPCEKLFSTQSDRYKYGLLRKELKTFVIEYGDKSFWLKYVKDEDYIFGLNNYPLPGNKEELTQYYKLNKDAIKVKIIELMKN